MRVRFLIIAKNRKRQSKKCTIDFRHNKTRKRNVYGHLRVRQSFWKSHLALQAGIEPASTVPETAILSIRLLEQLFGFNSVIIHYRLRACQHEPTRDRSYVCVSAVPASGSVSAGVLFSYSILRSPMISVIVLSCLTDDGLKSMYGMEPVALMVTRAP